MVNAVAVRQVLDLKIGAAFTRLMTMTLQTRMAEEFTKKVISYGKSQRKPSVVVMKEC
jgi:DNA topoisomerase-3